MLETDAGHRDPQIQWQVDVTPHLEAHGVAPRADQPFPSGIHGVVVAPPHGDDEPHAEQS
jgi:hypothetical protein